MGEQCFCLRWNNYQSNVVGDLRSLLEQEEFVDVTLACEGRRLKAHRLMLSACSNYFRSLLKENPSEHPIIFLRDVHFWELESIMDFIYNGQVNVMQDQLPGFIRTAEALQIKGLAAVNNNNNNTITPPKMYELKQIQDLLLRQPESLKESFSSRLRPPPQPLPNSFLTHEALNQANKLIPPLVHPSKRFRSENTYMNSSPYKDSLASRSSPNNMMSIQRNYPFSKDLSPPNGDAHQGCQDLSKKENPTKPNSDFSSDHKSPSLKRSPSSDSPSAGTEGGLPSSTGRLTPTTEEKNVDTKTTQENNGSSSRSGSPEEERTELEEDRSSHDGSVASLDGFKDEWFGSDQSSPMSIGVNEAGLPICKVCGKVFKHQGSLVAHYQVHQQRTKCPVCKKVLSRHYHMKVHLLTVHKVPDSEIEGLLRSQNIA